MLKMTIDNEEVLSNNDISIKEEILSPSSTILNNVYPKSWEQDKDYVSRFYYPKDYSKLNIQNFSIEPEEAGKTIQINGSATLTDVDTSKESRVLRVLGNTSQVTYTGKNKFDTTQITTTGIVEKLDTGFKMTRGLNGGGRTAPAWTNPLDAGSYKLISNLTKSSSSADIRMQVNYTNSTVSYYSVSNNVVNFGNTEKAIASIQFYFQNGTPTGEWAQLDDLMILLANESDLTYEPYVGGISSPNPNYPQDIHTVSGDNTIDICGKNLANINVIVDTSTPNLTRKIENDSIILSGNTNSSGYATLEKKLSQICPSLKVGDIATLSFKTTFTTNYIYITGYNSIWANGTSKTITQAMLDGTVVVYGGYNTTTTISEFMFEKGSTKTTYEPYTGKSYPISLGSIELCKIGTYQDYIYKDNGSWYLHKEIGKVVLNGSENWVNEGGGAPYSLGITNLKRINNSIMVISNYYQGTYYNSSWSSFSYMITVNQESAASPKLKFKNVDITSLTDFKTWLSTHNTIVYYVLANSTNILIEDTTLIEQLEALSS